MEFSLKVCDVTQCSICLETFKEPKALPCIHTFCLECLDKHCKERLSANTAVTKEVACPLCRKVFTIPPGGNKDLPNNFFILQLLQVNRSTVLEKNEENNNQHLCELCSDSEVKIPSTSYCIDCDQHICERCSMTHKKLKVSRSHQVIAEDEFTNKERRNNSAISYCDQHLTEPNRLYCYDCKMAICQFCIANKHKKHELADVNKSAGEFCEQLKDDVDKVTSCALKHEDGIKQLEIDTSLFMKKIATTQSEISQKYDQLISLIESHKKQLMEELETFRDKLLKEVETRKDELERQFLIAESFKRYCQEMMNKGTACDISRTANDLHARAEELMKTQDEPDCHVLSGVEITFKPCPSATDTVKNFIGELVLHGGSMDAKKFDFTKFLGGITVDHVMPSTGQCVTGIAVLGSAVFVVRGTIQVCVYKSDDFTLIRDLTISGSKNLQDLVSCSHYNCLYASDGSQDIIYKYGVTNNVTTNWSVGEECPKLSLTKCHNLLATLRDTGRIQEYTTHGSLIREISLDSSIDRPFHCIQLQSDNYVVCHEGAQQHRVCIVDQSGRIIQSYGGPPGSGVGQLYYPRHLAVDIHDNILVADCCNDKVLLLSPTLSYLGDIVIPGHELNLPYVICIDEQNHRLYIGEYNSGCMFVLNGNMNEHHFEE